MDPITTAIVAALANLSKEAVKDSYGALKVALEQKFGSESDLVDAIDKLEKKPDSEGRKVTLQEEVDNAKGNDDPRIVQLANELLDKLKEKAGEHQIIAQTISHVKYAATSGTGMASISSLTEHQDSKDS